jgi:hypothetical protein
MDVLTIKIDKTMKKFKLLIFFISVFIVLNTQGQNICAGKIIYMSTYTQSPVFGLQTGSNYYHLTINSNLINYDNMLIVDAIEYFVDDNVAITGTISIRQSVGLGEYLELEIATIEMLSSNRDIQDYLGIYEIQIDCTEPWWIGENATLSIVEETEINTPFDIRLFFAGQFGGSGFWASVLNDNSISIENWDYYVSGHISEHTYGEIYKQNDSIFIHLEKYHYGTMSEIIKVTDCHCNGKKISSSVDIKPEERQPKVFYDVTKQAIVIDETLQNKSLIFELIDAQGRVILRKANIDSNIDLTNLANGVYLYRLWQNNKIISSDTIIK